MFYPRLETLTVPQGPAARVEQGVLSAVVVAVVGVEVIADDVLQVAVLPVEVAGLDGPCEHCPVWPSARI